MNPSTIKVLTDLKRHKKGITFDHYPTGFRLGARIFDLREIGYKIHTIKEELTNGQQRAHYIFMGEK